MLAGGADTLQERAMGLLDILNGMQNGPRGQSTPSAQDSGGMSPITMAILALLAYKAVKHIGGGPPKAGPAPAASPRGGRRPRRRRRRHRPWMPGCPVAAWAAVLAIFSRAASAACSQAVPREA